MTRLRRRGRGLERAFGRGFGIPEALVALVIAGGAIAAFYNAVATGSMLDRRSDARAAAALEAYLLLDGFGTRFPLREGLDERGRTRGLDWRITVSSAPPAGAEGGLLADEDLLHIRIGVHETAAPERAFLLHAVRSRNAGP